MPQKVIVDQNGTIIIELTEHQKGCEWLGLPYDTDENIINEGLSAAIQSSLQKQEQEEKRKQARQRLAGFDTKKVERDLAANPNVNTLVNALTKTLQAIEDTKGATL
jgi:hypothetical protein